MRLAALALLALSGVSAYRDTSPLLIWSSQPNAALDEVAGEITSGVIAADSVYKTLPSLGCDFDALVVVHVDDLHHTHTDEAAALPLGRRADLHIPYLVNPERAALEQAARSWAVACGSGISWIDGKRGERAALPRSLPARSLVVYTGTRQERPFPSSSTLAASSTAAAPTSTGRGNSTVDARAPLLDRVQLLSTPVITALLISLFILVPIAAFGVSSLASIQVPPRMLEIAKSNVGREKKEQ